MFGERRGETEKKINEAFNIFCYVLVLFSFPLSTREDLYECTMCSLSYLGEWTEGGTARLVESKSLKKLIVY